MGSKEVGTMLERAVAEVGHNGLSRQDMSECSQEAPEHFLFHGLSLLKYSDNSPCYRFLALLLPRSPSLVQTLTARWRFQRAEAVAIGVQLQRTDQNFDAFLASFLPGRNNEHCPWVLDGDSLERALEILDQVSVGRKIVPTVQHLTRHKNPRVSAMSATLIGRTECNVGYAYIPTLLAREALSRST